MIVAVERKEGMGGQLVSHPNVIQNQSKINLIIVSFKMSQIEHPLKGQTFLVRFGTDLNHNENTPALTHLQHSIMLSPFDHVD